MSAAVPRTDLADRFTAIIDCLCPYIAAHAGLRRNWGDAPVIVLLHGYLRRLARRFAALAARGGAPAHAARPGPRHPAREPQPRRTPLPREAAWLLHMVPLVGNLGNHIHLLLASEEFAALLIAAPRAGAMMRPLCRMLGLGPEQLDLPRALFQPPPRATKPRATKPRPETPNSPAALSTASTAPPGRSLPLDAPQAGGPIPDPPTLFRPKQA